MKAKSTDYYSDIAQSGPPLFFPDPSAPVTFNFDQGVPDEDTFPLEELQKLHEEILERDQGRAMEYISMDFDEDSGRILYLSTYIELVLGNTVLRENLAAWLNQHSNRTDLVADSFILASGSVQAIALAINAVVNPGDGVLVESATFPYAMRYLDMRGGKLKTVDIDEHGMDPDSLKARLDEMVAEGTKPKLLYIVATFQLPTGVVTSLERRKRILELADEYDFLILEDNIYGDLRFSGEEIPTLLALDKSDRVMQSNGFSKTVAPGLRLGWVAGPTGLIAACAAVRQDLGVSQWTARVMAEYVARGLWDKHIAEVNEVYRVKRDVAAQAVRDFCEPWVSFSVPDGGFYLWLTLDDRVDWEKVRKEAEQNGVAFRPGERFMTQDEKVGGVQYLRLAFSHVKNDELRRGIEVLGNAIKSAAPA